MIKENSYEIIRLLGKFASEMAGVKTLQDLANTVEKVLEILIPTEHTGLYLYDPKVGRLKLLIAKGYNEEEKRLAEQTAMERHPGKVFKEKLQIHIPDVDSDLNKLSVGVPTSFEIKSRLYLPVLNNAECVGTFGVTSEKKNRFNENDIELLRFICQLAGVVYGNIILEELQREVILNLKLKDMAINASSNGILITDAIKPDNPLIFANPAFYKITGYSPEEVLGKNCRFLQGNDKEQKNLITLRNAIKRKEACKVLLRNYKKDGSFFWNELNISPIFNEEGTLINFVGVQNDITEALISKEKYIQSTALLSKLIHNIANGILVEDENRRIVTVNEEFCTIFGIPVDPIDLIGTDCSKAAEQSKHLLMKPEEFLVRIDEILRDQKIVKNDELEFKDGRIFERDYVPIYIEKKYKGHLWTYRNITERKTTEKELAELKIFYEKTLNDLPAQIAVFDSELRYLYVNPSAVKNESIRKWIIGKTDYDYVEFRNINKSVADLRTHWLLEAKNKKKIVTYEEELKVGKESLVYFQRSISPVVDEYGNVTRLLGYGFNITESKISNLELLKIKNQLELILNTTGEGIITIDKKSIIILVNDEVEKIFGWKKEELINKHLSLIVPKKYREKHAIGMQRYLDTHVPSILGSQLRLEGLKKNGTVFPLQIRVNETFLDGELYFTAAVNDISELNKLVQNLEDSNKALSDFAHIASHDLREPLRKISAFGSLLNKSLSGKLDRDNQENLDYMVDGAKRMQQMIDDLLYYSAIKSKEESYSIIEIDDIVNEIMRFDLLQLIEDNKAEIKIENKLGKMRGEKTQIKQILQNIIGNGIKYRKPDVNPVIKIRSKKTYSNIEIEIEDNGIGIDEKFHEQIFEMFKRLHSKVLYEGSGIGLAVCKKIVELYKGDIKVNSVPGNGTIFIIKLECGDIK